MLIKIKNNLDEIARLCDEVKIFCNNNGICEEKYHDIILILDELATNIINYAYPDGGTHIFTLDLYKDGNDRIVMKLSDDGIPFDPLAKEAPDTKSSLEKRQIGGLGIFIVKQLSEVVEYSRVDEKNHLSVIVSVISKNSNKKNRKEKEKWK